MDDFKGLEYHEFFEGRRIYIQGTLEEKEGYASRIDLLASFSDEPIHISINSNGGDLLAGIEIMRAIQLAQAKGIEVVGVVRGWACSSALIILEACSVRAMHRGDLLMAHGIFDDLGVTRANKEAELEALDTWISYLGAMFGRRTKKDSIFWADVFSVGNTHYWGASGAKRIGLVDKVIGG